MIERNAVIAFFPAGNRRSLILFLNTGHLYHDPPLPKLELNDDDFSISSHSSVTSKTLNYPMYFRKYIGVVWWERDALIVYRDIFILAKLYSRTPASCWCGHILGDYES